MGGYGGVGVSGGYLEGGSPGGVAAAYGVTSPHYTGHSSGLTSPLLGPSASHMNHMVSSGMGAAPSTASPSSSSSAEDFFLGDMGFPPRMKKKGRKPKPADGQGQQPGMKRKSREGNCSSGWLSAHIVWKCFRGISLVFQLDNLFVFSIPNASSFNRLDNLLVGVPSEAASRQGMLS